MKILISGGTGLVGRRLCRALAQSGHQLAVLSRDPERARCQLTVPADYFSWQPSVTAPPERALEGLNAIIHLAGEPVADRRWTTQQKSRIHESRVVATRNLVQSLLCRSNPQPLTLISASAIGYYGETHDQLVTETTPAGCDFLAKVCRDWETEAWALQANETASRVVQLRLGLVLSSEGGLLGRVGKLFRWGLGGRLGNGLQWLSWIHIDDLIAMIKFILHRSGLSGPINATAPDPVTNRAFTEALANAVGRPALFSVPEFAIRFAVGERANLFLGGTRAIPERIQNEGFNFEYGSISQALENLMR
ncbi:MAG: TIGR01777 family oxidoreductase [Bdellovibrionales bacterium]